MKLLGLRTIIYPAADLVAAKAWWTKVTGVAPYFDQPFYVGFEVGGYELGLDPNANPADGPITYWGVGDVEAAVKEGGEHGCTVASPPREVGEGIVVAALRNPQGMLVGLIHNPHFKIPA